MSDKIQPHHLERKAILYVRQSSAHQVLHNRESSALQYAMRGRLEQLGWSRIETIDEDLGRSAAGNVERTGFDRMVAEVCLGKVGAVAAREVSRFARNSRDWQQLIEMCRVVDTVLIDQETVYAPRQSNDRLLLGLKGSLNKWSALHLLSNGNRTVIESWSAPALQTRPAGPESLTISISSPPPHDDERRTAMAFFHTSSTRSGASRDSFHGCLAAFVEHLKQEGLTASRIRCLRASARHFLVWLDQEGIEIGVIDDAVLQRFRRHDCRCPGMERERCKMLTSRSRQFVSGALRLVRFFEHTRRIQHPGELDEGLRLLEEFLAECAAHGYAPDSVMGYRSACRHVLVWLHQSRIPMRRMDAEVLARFVAHDCVCPGPFESLRKRLGGGRYIYPVELFSRFLATRGVLPGAVSTTRNEAADEELEAFGEWLRRHRGIREVTIVKHLRRVSGMRARLGDAPELYNAALVRDVLLRQFSTASRSHARTLATSMRMYLRFLAVRGECSPTLLGAVPTAPGWRLCELPRYVPADDIERVIGSCNVTTPVGLRDRAILLLLARLALRAGDVVHLRLSDLDWDNARVRVCGKSRREVGLPLPQDAGDAVLDYIEHARPRIGEDRLFLTVRAPYRPFTSSNAITDIVIQALKRTGMNDVKPKGAYLFRHSAATNLLRAGASLDVIGALLRHRSPDTTVIYAKTDRPMLLEVVQPWIGDVR